MIVGLTISDNNMSISAERCERSLQKYGCDKVERHYIGYMPAGFPYFFRDNEDILTQSRGCGYWLWKPLHIHDVMRGMNNGDYLIYSDAGCEFISDVHHIINAMGDQDIFLFTNGWPHVEWCKWDIIDRILPNWKQEDIGLRSYKQVQASNIIIRVSKNSRDFVKEWLLYCQMPGLIDDSPSKTPNFPTFAENRHDQAVLTTLAIRDGIKLHWFPSTTNMHQTIEGDNYPVTFIHHRKRNHEW